jgi:hypothetical protein
MRAIFAGLLLAGSLLATPALAGDYSYSGDTTGGPTWNRPVAGSPPTPPVSGVGTATPYEVFSFTVSADGSYDFLSVADGGWDNYLFLYTGSFDPNDQFANVLIGNDDFEGDIGLSGFSYALTAGTTYLAVSSGFANTDFGAYTLRITGPGDITPGDGGGGVPEPATWAMMIAGFGLVGASARRRRTLVAAN